MPTLSWDTRALALKKHMQTDSWETFLQWATIQATMWVGDAWYIDEEYAFLPPRWRAVLEIEGFGAKNLPRYKTSGNLIHQAYHLALWEEATGQRVDALESIVEIGGGYGAAARLAFARGFTGRYYAYDLSPMLELQKYYVHNPRLIPCRNPADLPLFPDALFSFYAFSELPLRLRASLLAHMTPKFWAFTYQNTYDGLDNQVYFTQLILDHPFLQWQTLPAPGFVNHHYLFGCPTPPNLSISG